MNLAAESYATLADAQSSGAMLSQDDLFRLCSRAGRIHGPALLHMAWTYRVISAAVVSAMTGPVWGLAEYPEETLGRRNWLDLFTVAGFTVGGRPADRPSAPVKLWRGSVHTRRRRMSWTSNRDVAEKFALDGLGHRPPGALYQVTAPPQALLCVNNDRKEAERVIDTRGLLIQECPQ
jgi:hypothetical protein